MEKEAHISFKLVGDVIAMGFAGLKDTLPLITKYKKGNKIITGKWQTKKKS
jgi:hypothetical protein